MPYAHPEALVGSDWLAAQLADPHVRVVDSSFKLPGITQEQFDQVNKHIDPKGNPPKGILFHASGAIDDGWGVIDFWESRAHFDSFFGNHVAPAVQASGMEGPPPEIHEFPVHEYFKS